MLLNLILNALAQPNYKDVLGEVMNRTNKESEEYFRFIIFNQQLHRPPQVGQRKLFFERIIEQ